MNRFFPIVALLSFGALALPSAATAAPKLTAAPSLKAGRLVVTVSSARAFTARTRPRAVKVTAGGAGYKLKSSSRTARKSTWRSARLAAGRLTALAGEKVRIRIKTRAGSVSLRRAVPSAPVAPPGGTAPGTNPGPPAPGGGAPAAPPGITLTRDDAAGQQALAGGDLLLERVESGNVTMTYYRIFLYASSVIRVERADWNEVSGEICDSNARREGTWAFKEAYSFPEQGGGVLVKITTTTNGQTGDDLLTFVNQDPDNVYVGAGLVKYARNPNMRDQC